MPKSNGKSVEGPYFPKNKFYPSQIFNQITLVCHWFWDVDCSKAQTYYDFSNSRLYQGHDVPLLDNEDSYVVADALGAVAPAEGAPAKKGEKKNKKKAAA